VWLAVDIGGTKLAAALVDSGAALVRTARGSSRNPRDGDELFERLVAVMAEAAAGEPVAGIGVGCGGPMRWSEGLVSPVNIPAWRDFPLRDRIAAAWPGVPVRLHNDAIAMAAGEHWCGGGQGSRSLLAVVVSTGVGGGALLTGPRGEFMLLAGPTGNAGHVGHVVVDPDGPECGCGGRGCLEAIARGPATVTWATERGWRPASASTAADGPALVAAARTGDPLALAALTRCGQALGVALASTAHVLDLDRVVVGGGLALGAGELVLAPARHAFARHAVMDFARRCDIVPTPLGADAGLYGAAALIATDRYWPGAD
jgi:glucokinase